MRFNVNLVRRLIQEAILNAYQVLGLSPGASEAEVKAAWKKLALQNHPDRGGSHGKMVDINNAKDRLLNKVQMDRHGASFKGYEAPGAPSARPAPQPPPPAQSGPSPAGGAFKSCTYCGRRIWIPSQTGKFINHFTREGGSEKCPFSSMPPPPPQAQREPPRSANPRPSQQRSRVRRFEFTGGTSNKFWEVSMPTPYRVATKWGRIGSDGQTQIKSFDSLVTALEHFNRVIDEKLRKGYREVTGPEAAPNPTPGGAAPQAAGGKTYKVYGSIKDRNRERYYPHTRVKGTAYAPMGTLRQRSRFHQDDKVGVDIRPSGKARVSGKVKDYSRRPPTDVDHTQQWDPVEETLLRAIDEAVVTQLFEVAFPHRIVEALDDDDEEAIAELMKQPEFKDIDAFIANKLDNDEFDYGFLELQALARNAARKRTHDKRVTNASKEDIDGVRKALEGGMGFQYVAREPIKRTRGHLSNSHGTHPFAGSGGGGSGFGSDRSGTTFTSFGGGPGAIGGGYEWDAADPKNLSMGSKRKKR